MTARALTNTDDDDKPRLVSATAAARKMEDILRWKNQPFTPRPWVTAIRYDRDPTAGSGEAILPFPSDSVLTDGAAGVDTPTGVDQILELWAAWLSGALDTPTGKADGPWLLQQLHEHKDLHPLPNPAAHEGDPPMQQWATLFLQEWDWFTAELTRLWWRIANLTGNAPHDRTPCPKCRQGTLRSHPTNKGLGDEATCTNQACNLTINYSTQETSASIRAALRDPALTNTWLTLHELRTIWPGIRTSTLRMRVHNGHIRKQNGRYNLGDTNAWKLHQSTTSDTIDT